MTPSSAAQQPHRRVQHVSSSPPPPTQQAGIPSLPPPPLSPTSDNKLLAAYTMASFPPTSSDPDLQPSSTPAETTPSQVEKKKRVRAPKRPAAVDATETNSSSGAVASQNRDIIPPLEPTKGLCGLPGEEGPTNWTEKVKKACQKPPLPPVIKDGNSGAASAEESAAKKRCGVVSINYVVDDEGKVNVTTVSHFQGRKKVASISEPAPTATTD